MKIEVIVDASRLRQDLEAQQRRLARVARRVVNATAYQAVDDTRTEISRVFDRPTPFVLRGVYAVPSRDGDALAGIEARVAWREFGGAVTAQKVLRAQIEGGARSLKRFERAIGLPSNRVAVPGKWAPLDRFGNIPGPFIVQVLSALRLFGESGYRANRREGAKLRKNQSEFFMIRPGADHKSLSPGVYRVAREFGGAPLLVIAFVRAAVYSARFAPARVVAASVSRNIGPNWSLGLTGSLPFRRG